jgi:ubiquinone biosynthesis protein UbiJ
MRKRIICCVLALLVPLVAGADEAKVYRWVDAEGNIYFGDRIPPEFAEFPKDVLNERGVTVGNLAGKKTEEQKEAERIATTRRVAQELQQRADQALLATYLTVEEILMHRDRRIELFQAQSRVTELYLSNLETRLTALRSDASKFQPYSEDPDAPMIPEALADDLRQTKETISRHKRNLKKFQTDEQQIIRRFDGDISRFKILKGLVDT